MPYQELHHFHLSGIRGQHDCCVSSVVCCIVIHATVQEQLNDSLISTFRSPQQQCLAQRSIRVRLQISAMIDQKSHNPSIPGLPSQHKSCLLMSVNRIYLRTATQEIFDQCNYAALYCSH
jgi:hypothetical protein